MFHSLRWVHSDTNVIADRLLINRQMPGCLGQKAKHFDRHVNVQRPEVVIEGGWIFQPKDVEIFREESRVKVEDQLQEQGTSLNPEIRKTIYFRNTQKYFSRPFY